MAESSAASICPECASGVHVACRDEPGTSAECACPCGETPSAAQDRYSFFVLWLIGVLTGVGMTLALLEMTGALK